MLHRDTASNANQRPRVALANLIAGLPVVCHSGTLGTVITSITEDSRTASPGCLFIARPGNSHDGRRFALDAVTAGAAAVLATERLDVPEHVAMLVSSDVPGSSAVIAERFYGSASQHLQLIGVTGTNGKTTTTYLIQQLLATASLRCGLIGTVCMDDGQRREQANLTTPPAIELSRWLRRMVDNECHACVMEASSHALHQKRTFGLTFRIGVFTNLTGDHLDYHRTMDDYLAAKAILFEQLPDADAGGWAIINIDDPAGAEMIRRTNACVVRCSEQDESADCYAQTLQQTLTHTRAQMRGPWGEFVIDLPLIGQHNVMNALQAAAAAYTMDVDADALRRGLETCSAPPGRLEPVTTAEHPFAVLVDYAHTDDALENVLKALRPIVPAHGHLRVVFGCGGDRDRTKRPRMARVACAHADDIIVTSDNPRTEDPHAIIEEVRSGVPAAHHARTTTLVDRKQAIEEAVNRGREGDIILIAGKGHEDYQIIGTQKRPFDDRVIARQALRVRFEHTMAVVGGGVK